MPWNGLVGQHMQGRVCLQSWPLLGPFGRLLADFLRYSYYNRTITVLSYENRTFPYYNRTTTLRTNPVRPHATGPYQPRTTKARFLRNCPLCLNTTIHYVLRRDAGGGGALHRAPIEITVSDVPDAYTLRGS